MPTLDVNGYEFDYTESGNGSRLVLVHGSVSDRRSWTAQQDVFAKRHRTIAYSRRYHWPNAPIPDGADYAMQQQVDDLRQTIESLDAAPAHLVGHSYGAFLCLLLAIQSPELVRSLVLAEPPVLTLLASNQPKPHELLKLLVTRPSTAFAVIKFGATGIGPATAAFKKGDLEKGIAIFGRAVLGSETFETMPPERMAQVRANLIPAEFSGSGFALLHDRDVRRVQTPTLLIAGAASPAIFSHFTNRLHELLPNVHDKVTIPGVSHIMHEAAPDIFNNAVTSFLETQP